MARFLSQTLIRSTSSGSLQTLKFGVSQPNRFSSRSGKAQLIEIDLEQDEIIGLRKLDDAIHNIIVRQSAPDWLPFVPGSSYWVPPRRRPSESHGLVDVLNRLTNTLTQDESMSLSSSRGWPSSAYFIEGTEVDLIQGTYPFESVEVIDDNNQEAMSQHDDEEG